ATECAPRRPKQGLMDSAAYEGESLRLGDMPQDPARIRGGRASDPETGGFPSRFSARPAARGSAERPDPTPFREFPARYAEDGRDRRPALSGQALPLVGQLAHRFPCRPKCGRAPDHRRTRTEGRAIGLAATPWMPPRGRPGLRGARTVAGATRAVSTR